MVAGELDERIQRGEEIKVREIRDASGLETARSDYYTWNDYNTELLKRRFIDVQYERGYNASPGIWVAGGTSSLAERIGELHGDIDQKIRRLTSLRERLPLIEEVKTVTSETPEAPRRGSKVFIVHGHDEAGKVQLARFLEKLKLDVTILHDEANRGRTLIEKFESNASDAGYAIVLLTGDDIGGPVSTDEPRPRARQKVVFEAGFFFGSLGRDRVALLYEEGVELPSDVAGITYLLFDGSGAWHLPLARELRAAGFAVDMNLL